MHSLPLFHRIAGARVVVVGEGEMAAAKARLVERAGGIPCPETEAHYARLAFVALEDGHAAQIAALRLKRPVHATQPLVVALQRRVLRPAAVGYLGFSGAFRV